MITENVLDFELNYKRKCYRQGYEDAKIGWPCPYHLATFSRKYWQLGYEAYHSEEFTLDGAL